MPLNFRQRTFALNRADADVPKFAFELSGQIDPEPDRPEFSVLDNAASLTTSCGHPLSPRVGRLRRRDYMRNWCALKLNFRSRQPEPTRLCNNVLNYSREFAEEGSLCAIHARILRPRRNLLSVTSVQGRSKLFEIRGGHSMPTATAVINV